MKWDCGPDLDERYRRLEQWHRWFAWRPVRVASHDCRWLEWIERKGTFYFEWRWEYRA